MTKRKYKRYNMYGMNKRQLTVKDGQASESTYIIDDSTLRMGGTVKAGHGSRKEECKVYMTTEQEERWHQR